MIGLCLLIVAAVAAHDVVPFLDTVLVLSQLKSGVQLIARDKEGAANTQRNWLNQGIGPSQARSAYYLAAGEPAKAGQIQKEFLSNMEVVVDATPGVGHLKGLAHLMNGEKERGWNAIKSATSSMAAVVGAVALGPLGAVASRAATDLAISVVDKSINGNESKPHGVVEYVQNFGHKDAGEHFDAATGLLLDAYTGSKASQAKAKSKHHYTISGPSQRVLGRKETIELEPIRGSEPTVNAARKRPAEDDYGFTEARPKVAAVLAEDADDHGLAGPRPKVAAVLAEDVDDHGMAGPRPKVNAVDNGASVLDDVRAGEVPPVPYGMPDEKAFALMEPGSHSRGVRWNFMSMLEFVRFVVMDPWYHSFTTAKTNLFEFKWKAFKGLAEYQRDEVLDRVDVNRVTSVLGYMTNDERSLIDKRDFRHVNDEVLDGKNCVLCSVAALLDTNVRTLKLTVEHTHEVYDPLRGADPKVYLNAFKDYGYIDYKTSAELMGVDELYTYLAANADELASRRLILNMWREVSTEYPFIGGHTLVLKFKMVPDKLKPAMVFMDFQNPPFLELDLLLLI